MGGFYESVIERASQIRKTIVLPEGDDPRVIEAVRIIQERDFADVVVLGRRETAAKALAEAGVTVTDDLIVDPADSPWLEPFAERLYELRKAKGMTPEKAQRLVRDPMVFGVMMVKEGYADGQVGGAAHSSADTIRPALQIIGPSRGTRTVSSVFFMCWPERVLLFADCGLNVDPDASQLVDIAVATTRTAFLFGITPRLAMLSYSTKGSGSGPGATKVARAADRAAERIFALFGAGVVIDGEVQFDAAFVPEVAAKKCPDSPLKGGANVFIFPDLGAGNITYKAVQRLAGADAFGPVLQGLDKPVNDLSRGCLVQDVVAGVAITAVQASEGPLPA